MKEWTKGWLGVRLGQVRFWESFPMKCSTKGTIILTKFSIFLMKWFLNVLAPLPPTSADHLKGFFSKRSWWFKEKTLNLKNLKLVFTIFSWYWFVSFQDSLDVTVAIPNGKLSAAANNDQVTAFSPNYYSTYLAKQKKTFIFQTKNQNTYLFMFQET
jgi:hypothetical protein